MLMFRNSVAFLIIHPQISKRVAAKIILMSPALRYLWVNDYKGNGISGRDHYMFFPSGMLGTACTVSFGRH